MSSHPFNDDEIIFLKEKGFSEDDVFIIRKGMSKSEWQELARKADKPIALGNGCRKFNHRLKWRSGHCAPCNPHGIAYQDRHRALGYVYIARSQSRGWIKIGQTKDINHRISTLNSSYERYGEVDDWQILFYIKVDESGHLEQDVHRKLESFLLPQNFIKGQEVQIAREIFTCSFEQAHEILTKEASKKDIHDQWTHPSIKN